MSMNQEYDTNRTPIWFLGNNIPLEFLSTRDPLKYEESFNKKDGRLRPCQQKQHGLHRAEIWEENWD